MALDQLSDKVGDTQCLAGASNKGRWDENPDRMVTGITRQIEMYRGYARR